MSVAVVHFVKADPEQTEINLIRDFLIGSAYSFEQLERYYTVEQFKLAIHAISIKAQTCKEEAKRLNEEAQTLRTSMQEKKAKKLERKATELIAEAETLLTTADTQAKAFAAKYSKHLSEFNRMPLSPIVAPQPVAKPATVGLPDSNILKTVSASGAASAAGNAPVVASNPVVAKPPIAPPTAVIASPAASSSGIFSALTRVTNYFNPFSASPQTVAPRTAAADVTAAASPGLGAAAAVTAAAPPLLPLLKVYQSTPGTPDITSPPHASPRVNVNECGSGVAHAHPLGYLDLGRRNSHGSHLSTPGAGSSATSSKNSPRPSGADVDKDLAEWQAIGNAEIVDALQSGAAPTVQSSAGNPYAAVTAAAASVGKPSAGATPAAAATPSSESPRAEGETVKAKPKPKPHPSTSNAAH